MRAAPADPFRGRRGRRRVHGHRRVHRPQIAVAPRALDGRGRARRGRSLALRPSGRRGGAGASRRARTRPRPGRRVEHDLGEAGPAELRGVGAGATPLALHGALQQQRVPTRAARTPGCRSSCGTSRGARAGETTRRSMVPALRERESRFVAGRRRLSALCRRGRHPHRDEPAPDRGWPARHRVG